MNWKNGQAQGFALFTTGAYARAACDAITQLLWVDRWLGCSSKVSGPMI